MQGDFDKILKENLKGYAADFNAADWQQMEAMLPKKSKKPYALIALLLLLFGIGGLLVGTGEFQKENSAPIIVQNNHSDNAERNTVIEFQNENTNAIKKKEALSNSKAENADVQKQNQVATSGEKTENGLTKESEYAQTPSPKGEGRFTHRSLSEGGGEVATKKRSTSNQKNLAADNDSQKTSSRKKTSINNFYETNSHQSYSSSIENANGNSAEIQNNTEIISALASIESGFINLNNEEKILTEKSALSDDAAPKHKLKKQIVAFALGGGTGMNFSFTDATRWAKPGYIVDVAQEIMFINRIGIAFTQGYSVRNYDGGQYPCSSGTIDCPTSYSSSVRSVDFGVDLKANLIHKSRWNWYVKTGIINTVKLKEEFSYSFPQTDTIMPPTLPPQTNFNGGSFNEAMQDNLSGLDKADYPPDLTISGLKRYHLAFHSATGFDVALNSKLQLQLEAGHSFTQPTAGVDDKRLHSIGVNGRLFYRFGR